MTPKQALRDHIKSHGCDCPGAAECQRDEHYDSAGRHVVPGGSRCEIAQHLAAVVAES